MKKKLIFIFGIYFCIIISSIFIFQLLKTKTDILLTEEKEFIVNLKKGSEFLEHIKKKSLNITKKINNDSPTEPGKKASEVKFQHSEITTKTKSNSLYITTSEYLNNKKHGKEITKDKKTGNILKVSFYINGKKDGLEEIFYPEGNILKILKYFNGVAEGEFIEYYRDGQIKYRGIYKSGKFDGEINEYYENGEIKKRINYSKGLRNGLQEEYSVKGILLKRLNFINDKEDGEIIINDSDGKLQKKYTAIEGLKNGVYQEYDKFGEKSLEVTYNYGKKQGNEISYKKGKPLSETYYINGKKEGKYIYYNENRGLDSVRVIGEYKDNKKVGKWFFYEYSYEARKNILREAIEYANGLYHGKKERFREDETKESAADYNQGEIIKMYNYGSKGQKISERDYLNNTPHGEEKTFFSESGKLKSLTTYKYGDADGESIKYNEDGTIESKGNYHRGVKIGEWKSYRYIDGKQLESYQHYNEIGERDGVGINYRYVASEDIYVIEKLNFKDDKLDGEYESLYMDGSLYARGQYKNYKKTGFWQQRYFDSRLKKYLTLEGVYNNDKEIGKWFCYDEDRKIISGYEYFENGRIKFIDIVNNEVKEEK